jgi:hypothetical protein
MMTNLKPKLITTKKHLKDRSYRLCAATSAIFAMDLSQGELHQKMQYIFSAGEENKRTVPHLYKKIRGIQQE